MSSLYSDSVSVVEVGPRDGLQNEKIHWSVEDRIELLQRLTKAGVRRLEAGAFVSPKAIPQMEGSESLCEKTQHWEAELSYLVPNEKGLERAIAAKAKHIAVFTATSAAFTQKNIGMTTEESLDVFRKLIPLAMKAGLHVRGYISTAFGCPYEGPQEVSKVVSLSKALLEYGCFEISIGDTIGVAHPRQIKDVFGALQSEFSLEKFAGHFHDTRGGALANVATALEMGIRTFDSSIGGLGGCPYAMGSSGNLATEELVWLLEGFGLRTGIQIAALIEMLSWIQAKIGRNLKGKLFLSEPKRFFYW